MSALRTAIAIGWVVFWAYWLIAAIGAKAGSRTRGRLPPGVRILVLAFVATRLFAGDSLAVHSIALQIVGAVAFVCGLGLAVWARIYLGRNWGMPMTQKEEPELITEGPYRLVRHPIYTGILLGLLGTALAINLYWLIAVVFAGAYFIYSARVEERNLITTFPTQYPPLSVKDEDADSVRALTSPHGRGPMRASEPDDEPRNDRRALRQRRGDTLGIAP
jgi:protein-S-isoprenylcysteine O-methyltransferase Ste14